MPINRLKTHGDDGDDTLWVLRDPDDLYEHEEICDLLEKAEKLGFSLERGTELEKLTVRELDVLVNRRQ